MTTFYLLGSLVLGLGAWALAVSAITGRNALTAYRCSSASLILCAVSLLLELLEVGHRAGLGDFSAIDDTIHAVVLAASVLIVVTVVLNLIAVVRAREKI